MPYTPIDLPTDEVGAMEAAIRVWHPNLPAMHAKEVLREYKRIYGGGADLEPEELVRCGNAIDRAAQQWERLRLKETFKGEWLATMARAVIDEFREIRRRK